MCVEWDVKRYTLSHFDVVSRVKVVFEMSGVNMSKWTVKCCD